MPLIIVGVAGLITGVGGTLMVSGAAKTAFKVVVGVGVVYAGYAIIKKVSK